MRFILRVWLQPSAYVDEEGVPFVLSVFTPIKQRVCLNLHALKERVLRWIKPLTTSLVLETFADLTRGKAELLAENTLLRHQLIILRRQVKRPVYKKTDRFLLVFLAGMVRAWNRALFLAQPETLLRWHRELFRLFWKHKSKAQAKNPSADPGSADVLGASTEPAKPGDRLSSVGWVTPRLPKSGLNHRRRMHQAEVEFD